MIERRSGRSADGGAAMVEFVILVVALVVPLVYLVLAVFEVQRAAFAANAVAREAARVFVTSSSTSEAEHRARTAAGIALTDHGLAPGDGDLSFRCTASPCLTPGERVEVGYQVVVALPFLPRFLHDRPLAGVSVSASHSQTVDRYAAVRP